MKLAEALQEKSRLKKKIYALRGNLEQTAPAKAKPDGSPKKLLRELNESLDRMEYLSAAIQHTNELIKVNGRTVTQWISGRDILFYRLELYKELLRQADDAENRSPADLNLSELQAETDRMLWEIRHLDNLIQKTNWTKDLIE